jgi:hypothetical protein
MNSARGGPCREETPNLLVVEGADDCNGIYQIAVRSGIEKSFGIWEGRGDQGALERFGGLLLSSRNRPKVPGIVLDCDADDTKGSHGVARRWAQVQNRLAGMPYQLPSGPDSGGTIIEGVPGFPRIGVWLMPDNEAEGMFEDFLLRLVPAAALTFAQETVRAAKDRGHGNYKASHESKAVAHSYLAWQDEPGKPIGIAIRSGAFNIQSGSASAFASWLHELFQPSSG